MVITGCNSEVEPVDFKPTVYIEKGTSGYQLIRNGKPFYIHGGAAHGSYLEELKEAGANTARIYDTINLKATLDQAQLLGLAAVVDIPLPKFHTDPEFYEDETIFKQIRKNIELVVQNHKDHPALLYWNLGNELYYPYFYKNTHLHTKFNILIDLIHDLDPNHPVSTTTIGANKLRVLSIITKSPQLDFISFNSFGTLSTFSKKLKPLAPIWTGPHVITEWGVNGPWEASLTSWKAPIEETSTKKAEQIKQRHKDYIIPLKEENSLGSFVFYWGKKNEITPTWYSLFGENMEKTQPVFELSKIWSGKKIPFPGPELEYILMNDKGALDNLIVLPEANVKAEVILPKSKTQQLEYHWEVRHESWNKFHISITVENIVFSQDGSIVNFTSPLDDGPYRLFLYASNDSEYIATANFPFYVLNASNGE